MSGKEAVRPYRWLAEYYDRFFKFGAVLGAAMRGEVLREILPRVESACDLACGTGTTAMALARKGIRMSGVDLSPAMCRLARQKARACGRPFHVMQADMRDFRLPQPVDLVLCEFDALNHVPKKEDLALVARCVARALRPGGYFYCDVNNRLSFEKVWPTGWFQERDGVVMMMYGGYDRECEKGWANIEWFFREGKLWRRRRERVEQVHWTTAEFRRTLRAAGFGKITAQDQAGFFKDVPGMTPGCRTIYLARKA